MPSLPVVEVAIASILPPCLWPLQTRSWRRRPESHVNEPHRARFALAEQLCRRVKNRDGRPGLNRQTEHRVLARPLGRSIAQASDADATRQSSFDSRLHEFRHEERERDRHIDLSNAACLPRSDLLDTGDAAGNDLTKPTPATRDRCNKRGAGLGANGSKTVWRDRYRRDDLAPSLHRHLFPWDA